eukprot:CAMPEP_0176206824 /NCGR_PEP_ID=MMETSP0121_2-20121125/12301_1 /TAXON_ID=160619 /ORGANISM="Kryptoperidinium foliaceum, Strain CCMP 1326" /LENGTH=410 /DNA_ID=CAMNT_0017545785 /DNA_START=106 /DNA_END=1335 /DNA_ORIENTATION=+
MVAAAWSAHGMPSCPPGLELPQDSVWDVPTPRAPEQAPGSGGRTPDFVTARGWPANAGDSAQHSDGADTPRDATAGAMLIMDQVCSKLRSLELETRGALSKPLAETAQKVPMPYGLLSRAAAPILTTAPPAYAAAGDACRPPPGLPLPPTHHSPVPPPPPEPVVPRASAKMTFAHPKFVVSYGSVGHPLQCGGMCQRDDCELGAQCPSCHICRAEEAAAQARQLDEAQKVDDQCASVGSIGASVHLRGGVQVPSEAPGLQGRRAVHALPRVPLEPLPEEGSCPAPHAEPGVLRLPRPLRTFGVWVGVHHSSDWARVGLHAVDAPPSALRATGAPAAECVERAARADAGACAPVCIGSRGRAEHGVVVALRCSRSTVDVADGHVVWRARRSSAAEVAWRQAQAAISGVGFA